MMLRFLLILLIGLAFLVSGQEARADRTISCNATFSTFDDFNNGNEDLTVNFSAASPAGSRLEIEFEAETSTTRYGRVQGATGTWSPAPGFTTTVPGNTTVTVPFVKTSAAVSGSYVFLLRSMSNATTTTSENDTSNFQFRARCLPGPSASQSTISASPTSIVADGATTSTITVQLKNSSGSNLTFGGSTVVLSTTLGSLGSVTDNGDGTYTATLTSSVTSGTATITGTVNGSSITDDAEVEFTPIAASAATSTITASPTSIVADGATTSTVTVQLKDANGNDLVAGGDTVALFTTLGSLGSVTDNGDGSYTATLTSATTAGTATVTGTVNSAAIADDAEVEFTPGVLDAGESTVTASSPHTANGIDDSTVTIVLVDANGNAIAGLTNGDFSIGLTGSAVAGTVSETATPGTYEVAVTNTVAETVTVTVTADGAQLTDQPQIVFQAGDVDGGDSTVTATSPHTADGVDASTVTIVLMDGEGNAITGLTNGDFSIGLTGSAAAGTVSETATPGTYEVAVTNTVAETVTVTVTADGEQLSDQPQIVFGAGDVGAGTSSVTATSPHIADGSDASTVTVALRDANNNPVTGLGSGNFLIAVTGAALAGGITETATPGTYQFPVTNATAETVTVTATANGVTLTQTASIVFEEDGIDEQLVRDTFTNVTRAFLLRRMDRILSHEPENARLIHRLSRFGAGRGLVANAESTANGLEGDFAFSLSGVRRSLAALEGEGASDADVQFAAAGTEGRLAAGSFDIWAEGHFSLYDDDAASVSRSGSFGIVYAGFDYRLTESILIGLMGQIDWAEETSSELDSEVRGDGWMVGPYLSAELLDGVYLDLRGAWGRSSNRAEIDVFANGLPFSGDFDTERWLVRGALSGTWESGGFVLTPEVSIAYMEERQHDYTVNDGVNSVDVDGQSLSLGRFAFKPEVAYLTHWGDTALLPYVKPQLLWDFESAGEVTLDGQVSSEENLRGAVELGLRAATSSGLVGGFSVTYDGIGQENFEAIEFSIGLSFSF